LVKKGLGKGLDALFSSVEAVKENKEILEKEIQEIKINDIEPNSEQPRKFFNDEKINTLAESIKQHGIIQPIVVKNEGNIYKIIAGERRWRAARIAGLKTIPVIVKNISSRQVMEIALIENIQREDLNPIEEAEAYDKLLKEYNLTQEKLSEVIGKSRSAIANTIRLLILTEKVKNMLIEGAISSGHARTLITITDKEKQETIAEEIVNKGLNVRETEKLIKKINISRQKNIQKEKDVNILEIENKLKDLFGTKVEIQNNKNNGKILIEYYSKEELDRIMELIEKI